jgi:MoxR-like ATPase
MTALLDKRSSDDDGFAGSPARLDEAMGVRVRSQLTNYMRHASLSSLAAFGRARHCATRSIQMPDTAIHPIPKQGKFRHALAAASAWLQALDYTGFDYILDRTEHVEQELARLKEELRQSREASSGDAHLGGAVNPEH